MNLEGTRAWITGASSGIGAATAIALGRSGMEVVLTARRQDRLERVADQVEQAGGTALIEVGDVSDRSTMERLGAKLTSDAGVQVLVAAAGLMPLAPLKRANLKDWERMVDVNFKGVLYAVNAVYPDMAERGTGHIVTVSSVAAFTTFPTSAVYSGTKAAVRLFADGLRKEALRYNVRVTDVQPGAVATDLPDTIGDDRVREKVKANLYADDSAILAPEDVANAIHYAVAQPHHVDVGELILRPTIQE